jgi:XTP/dITP diphosphohydrolase
LGGAPGVISSHYAGELPPSAAADREARRALQDAANNTRLLQALQAHPEPTTRRAAFVSTLVAVRHAQDPQPLVAVGRWPGQILAAPRGAEGFGYDPLMFIPDLGCTVAQMDAGNCARSQYQWPVYLDCFTPKPLGQTCIPAVGVGLHQVQP